MIKNIIFDFGGVVLKHKATLIQDILNKIFPDDSGKAEEIFQKHKIPLNTGKNTSDDFIFELKKNIGTTLTTEEIKHKWKELYKREVKNVDWKLLDFIERLKEKYKVYLFTDTIDVHDEYNKTRNIYERFHKAYKSFEEGVAKSAGKESYLYLLSKIGAVPEECLFIDDLENNVRTAEEVGIKGIVYKNLNQLQKRLELQGIEV